MSTQKKGETSKQERSAPAAKTTKKDEVELSEKELGALPAVPARPPASDSTDADGTERLKVRPRRTVRS